MPGPSKPKISRVPPETAHRIHSLLQTMRTIQQHEDRFCTLMHAIERAGKLSATDGRELHMLLDQMPGESLLHELTAVRESLPPRPAAAPARARKTSTAHAH